VAGLSNKKEAFKIIYYQLLLITILALPFLLLQSVQSGFSVILGGLAYWLPTFLFVWRIFARESGAQAAKQFLLLFVAGESIKLLLSGGLFVLIVKFMPVKLLSVLIGFIGAVIAFWIASIFILARHEGVKE
jgi:ATP synthase protein I